ncbi:hypothetical protein ID866_5398 [Astraeus odoratus]|nr:hypothetical protein ID866_5398 [Astraeus odoratus]
MGGSASGPRLKRHEPQADAGAAHDGRIEHGSVHPIFGRGGVAMPGMVGKGGGASPAATAASTTAAASSASLPTPSSATLLTTPRLTISDITRPRTTSTLAAARRYVEKLEERAPPQPQALGLSASGVRARRLSTPTGGSPADLRINTPGIASRPLFQNLTGKAVSFDTRTKSPAIETRPKTPTSDLRPKIPAAAEGRPKTPAAADVRPKTPTADTWPETPVVIESRLKTPVNNFRAKTPVEGSRAEAPSGNEHTKTPIQSPTFPNPPSGIASPCPPALVQPKSLCPTTHSPQPQRGGATAFLRAQTGSAKDPTPSISRLQGRGFVQSIVQASQAGTQGTPASVKSIFSSPSPSQVQPQSEARDKSARRASVLDRWQPAVSSSGFSPSGSPRVSSPTRSHTVTPKQGEGIPPVKTHDTGRSVRSTVSMPAIPKTSLKKSDDADEKLGSASTMVSFIKPAKTGDNPLVAGVDELGVKTEGTAGSGVGASDYATGPGAVISTKTPRIIASALPSSPGIPLSHVRPLR